MAFPRAVVFMTEVLDAHDERYWEALHRAHQAHQFRIEDVLLPTQWRVAMVDGAATVCLSAAGVRALALVSPAHVALFATDVEAVVEEMARKNIAWIGLPTTTSRNDKPTRKPRRKR